MTDGRGPSETGCSVHPVDPSRWGDLQTLFESRGGPGYCWCMPFRVIASGGTDKAARKGEMQRRVAGAEPVGLLAYLAGLPVGWCSIAPRSTFKSLGAPPMPADPAEVPWSLTCFFVSRAHRGAGLSDALILAALAHAKASGATVLEAYPVDPDSPSYRFMGFVAQFESHGFTEVGRAGTRRHVMRKTL